MSKKTNCGIYALVNDDSGKMYIGSSKNLRARKSSHLNSIKGKKHSNPGIREDVHNSFSFKILHELPADISVDALRSEEQDYINRLGASHELYNVATAHGIKTLTDTFGNIPLTLRGVDNVYEEHLSAAYASVDFAFNINDILKGDIINVVSRWGYKYTLESDKL